jgi:hypothetical protein
MYNINDSQIKTLECALLNHYKTQPGMYKSEIKVSEARKILRNIVGIKNTNTLSDLDITDLIIDIEDNNITTGKLHYNEHCNSYRTA